MIFGFLKKTQEEVFAFNLLPPKTKEEVEAKVTQSKLTIYTFMIPVACLAIALIIFLINQFAIVRTLNGWENLTQTTQASLDDPFNEFGQPKVVNGELTLKALVIEEPIQRNVDFATVFQIAQDTFGQVSTVEIDGYGRESDGKFIINATSTSESGPSNVYSLFRTNQSVVSSEMRQVNYDSENNVFEFSVGFIADISQIQETGS